MILVFCYQAEYLFVAGLQELLLLIESAVPDGCGSVDDVLGLKTRCRIELCLSWGDGTYGFPGCNQFLTAFFVDHGIKIEEDDGLLCICVYDCLCLYGCKFRFYYF